MTDQTPGEQNTSRQQAPEGFIEKHRFDGLVRKVEELTLTNRNLTDELGQKTSDIEHLKAQLGLKDTEKTVAVGERDKMLEDKVKTLRELEREIADLRGLKLKIETIKKLGRPELLKIADKIPAMEDAEALETVMKEFAGFADDMVRERERQILAGTTPGLNPGQAAQMGTPASEADWQRHIGSMELGSLERQKAMDAYWDWGMKHHK
jgi:predicted RNase H-like nuclease (RuvC/YqgF family)